MRQVWTRWVLAATALVTATTVVAISPTAQAGVLIEPYLGYHTGTFERSGSFDEDLKGISYGARLGYQMLGVMFGIDYMTGKWEDTLSPAGDDVPSDLAVFVGYNFPVLLRVYGAYGFDTELEREANSQETTYEGRTIKLGVGFTGLPMVSVNLEYITSEFDKTNSGNLSPKAETELLGLTVSLPFDL